MRTSGAVRVNTLDSCPDAIVTPTRGVRGHSFSARAGLLGLASGAQLVRAPVFGSTFVRSVSTSMSSTRIRIVLATFWASQLCVVMPLRRTGWTQSAGTLKVSVRHSPGVSALRSQVK